MQVNDSITAIYRGCFDDFADVDDLSYDYVGCRNQSWNNRQLPWCLCDTPFCNGDSMRHLGAYSGTTLNTARKGLGRERSGIFPDRVFEGRKSGGSRTLFLLTYVVTIWVISHENV